MSLLPSRALVALSLTLTLSAGCPATFDCWPLNELPQDCPEDDDSAEDDDTSLGDDDSAGDDDTSTGDDDVSAGDDDVSEEADADSDGSPDSVDCDDINPDIHPGAVEICNGVDDDCDSIVPADELDDDGDVFSPCQGDCDDDDREIFPGAVEICDSRDQDCDGEVDDGLLWLHYPDGDGDGYGSDSLPGIYACVDIPGYTHVGGDCMDVWGPTGPTIYPGAPELCDEWDNDCDGIVPADELDVDGDRDTRCEGDCDETDPYISPDGYESCDGIDNNCDGEVDEDFDLDGDGWTTCGGDCDDSNPSVYPGTAGC